MITEQHLEWALCHLESFGGSDVFPPSHDYLAIRSNWTDVKNHILSTLTTSYLPGTPYLGMSPKSDHNFRAVHELSPIDSIIITAVIYSISHFIERSRIPEDRRTVFSFRLDPDHNGRFFRAGSDNWTAFTARRAELFEKYKDGYVLKADIADFYNQIYLHRVKNALEECLPAEMEDRAVFVHDFLHGLNSKVSKGIPVGPAFSTVLAEAVLNDVDHRIAGYGLEFVRWVDDFYIFHKEGWVLYNKHHSLTEYLYSTHRLVFNGSKTKMTKVSDFREFLEGTEDAVVERQINILKEKRCAELMDEIVESMDPYDHSEIDWDSVTEKMNEKYEQKEAFQVASKAYQEILKHAIQTSNMTLTKHVLKRCTAARVRSIYPIVKDSLVSLLPVIREVAFYVRRACTNDLLIEFSNSAAGLCKVTENKFTLRWLAYILTLPEYPAGHNLDEEVYSALELRDQLSLAMSKGDLYRIKSLRTSIEQLPNTDRYAFIMATTALTKDERNPILECVERRGRLLDASYCKYVRSGISKR